MTPSWPPAGYGVWGRPVNHAQRLCALAGPGEVQVRVGPAAAPVPKVDDMHYDIDPGSMSAARIRAALSWSRAASC